MMLKHCFGQYFFLVFSLIHTCALACDILGDLQVLLVRKLTESLAATTTFMTMTAFDKSGCF